MTRAAAPRLDCWQAGTVPLTLEGAAPAGPLIDVTASAALLRIPGVARCLARPDAPPVVDREDGIDEGEIGCFVRGPVAALGEILAGRYPLRASAVAIGDRAVVLGGVSGSGKSTLAAALAQRGHRILADGLVTIGGDPPRVCFAREDVDLWPDSVVTLGLDEADGEVVRAGLAKRSFRWNGPPGDDPVPLASLVVVMEDGRLESTELRPVDGADALARLFACGWHPSLVEVLGLGIDHLEWGVASLTGTRVVDARRAKWSPESTIPSLADQIEGLGR